MHCTFSRVSGMIQRTLLHGDRIFETGTRLVEWRLTDAMNWRRWLPAIAVAGLLHFAAEAQSPTGRGGNLNVTSIDVEGGQATLFVTPAKQSLLIDTGWPGDTRDADRIVDAARKAGLRKIDYVLITHYHTDHVGGVANLLAKIHVAAFIDHGPTRETDAAGQRAYDAYEKALAMHKLKRITVKPGDVLPIVGMKATVISADGEVIGKPLEDAGEPNAFCKDQETPAEDMTENGRSVGVQIVFGKLKLIDLGDLTKDREMSLMCPLNRLGHADVLIVSHHGSIPSSSPALVKALGMRVAIMNSGGKKGGAAPVLETVASAPGLETMWQLHFSEEGGAAHNAEEQYIANLEGPDEGHYLELVSPGDGSFDVFNSRTGATKHYAPLNGSIH